MNKPVLVTGAAGFIGFHLCRQLLNNGYEVLGVDNLNQYYDLKLKEKRLEILNNSLDIKSKWIFRKVDLTDETNILEIFKIYNPNVVINLAAQAGVRYSLENPKEYINSNIVGFSNLLECCKKNKVKNLIYASSSSVYGGNTKFPFSEEDSANHPLSLYAATKRSNELLAHSYSHLYGIPCTGVRFFTVYGPWGRPDMAPMIFAEAIINRKPLKIFNYGKSSRSFTFIDDVIEILVKLIKKPSLADKSFDTSKPNHSTSWCPHRILNVGNENSVGILKFLQILEKELGLEALKEFEPLQRGDVISTSSDNTIINDWIGIHKKTSLEKGVKLFIDWYKNYYI